MRYSSGPWANLLAALLVASFVAFPEPGAESRIREVLAVQVAAWNRGDIPAFVKTYAPKCTFVGTQVIHGRDAVLARYRKRYPTPDAMGHLTFGSIDVQQLDRSRRSLTELGIWIVIPVEEARLAVSLAWSSNGLTGRG